MDSFEKNLKKYHIDLAVLLACLVVLSEVTFRIVYKQSNMDTDYYSHMWLCESFAKLFDHGVSYPMWHLSVCLIYTIMGKLTATPDLALACALFTTIVNICIYFCIRHILKLENVRLAEIVSLALCFVTPVYFPKFSQSIYLGQGSPVTWHNPTNMMVKPFALLSFILIIGICEKIRNEQKATLKEYIWLAALVALSVVAKPSYYQSIVPALGVYMIIMLIIGRGKHFLEYVKLCVAFVPTAALVLYQFIDAFYSTGESQGIGIKWAEGAVFTSNVFISLLLVILFPLAYTLLNIKKCWNKTEIHLVWMNLLVAWLENMLLYEKGIHLNDGNFSWAMNLAFTILWVYILKDFVLDLENAGSWKKLFSIKNIILFALLVYHMYSGILYCRMLLYIPECWY